MKGMTMRKRIGIAILIAMVGAVTLGLGGRFSLRDVPALISTAAAYVNRTVSPVYVQNSARADWSGCIPSLGGC
jgi:hypothetical protein